MYDSLYSQPSNLNRKFIWISVTLHVLAAVLVLISPLFRGKNKQFQATKFFQVVDVKIQQKTFAKPKPKPPEPVKPKVKEKPKLVPATKPQEVVHVKEPEPQVEPEYKLPTEIVAVNQNFQYDWYLNFVVSKVEKYWQPPRGISGEEDRTVLVHFVILASGEVTGLRIESSSGEETLDRLALRSIQRAAPFPRLPPQWSGEELTVRYKLNYIL